MSKKSVQAKIVTARDLEIMRLVGTDGVARLKVIHERFWPGASERTCRERLTQLEKAGWLESHFVDTRHFQNELVFSLTARGAKIHFNQAERKFLIMKLPAYNEISQQFMVQEARFRLQKRLQEDGLKLAGWLNERQLRSQARLQRAPGTRAWGSLGGIADAQAVIVNPATGEVSRQNIEADGDYFGKKLREKIEAIGRAGISTLWVTTPTRVKHISLEINRAGARGVIEIMVIG